jgi:hypothetical protein
LAFIPPWVFGNYLNYIEESMSEVPEINAQTAIPIKIQRNHIGNAVFESEFKFNFDVSTKIFADF